MRESPEETKGRETRVRNHSPYEARRREEALLVAAGFKPAGGSLWEKEGVLFGRKATLQWVRKSATNS
jgi:hypothetical protein